MQTRRAAVLLALVTAIAAAGVAPPAGAQVELLAGAESEDALGPQGLEDSIRQLLMQMVEIVPADPARASTAGDPEISEDELEQRVMPLPLGQMWHEVEAWRQIVEERARALAEAEIELIRLNEAEDEHDAAKSEAEADPAAPASTADDQIGASAMKRSVIEEAAARRDLRTQALDRFRLVLDAFEEKGGEPRVVERYHRYANSVSGVRIEVSDSESAFATISSWLVSQEGGIRLLKNLGLFVGAIIASVAAGWLLSTGINAGLKRTAASSQLLRRFLRVWIRRLAIVIGALIGLAALEINITPLLAALGAVGFILAFSLQNTLSNLASGLLIMIQKPFDVGDEVEAAEISGRIDKVTLFSTYLSTAENKQVIVPNNMIWDGIIVNATSAPTRRLAIEVEVDASEDLIMAEAKLLEVMRAHPEVLDDPPPEIRLIGLSAESYSFICWPWAPTVHKDQVRWDLVAAFGRELKLLRGSTKAAA